MPEPNEPSRMALQALADAAHRNGLQPVLSIDEFDILVDNPRVGQELRTIGGEALLE